jgi:hypothetical protein
VIGVAEAVYDVEVDEKAPETLKPARLLPLLENERVNGDPATIVTLWVVPSAANVVVEGYPPFMVTVEDGAELFIVTVISWTTVFTVKTVEAELRLASVITTVCGPAVEIGTVKVAPVNEPVLPVVVAPLRLTVTPLKVALNALLLPKPVPDTETVEPTLPFVGFKEILEVVVKISVSILELESVAETLWEPAVEIGTAKVQLNVPNAVVVTVAGDVVWIVPSYLMVTVFVEPYPVPETVIVVPVDPLAGLSVINGVIVKVLAAEFGGEELSLAWTVLAPAMEEVAEPEGIVIVATKEPTPSVVIGDGEVGIAEPAKVNVTVLKAPKPCPVTVTVVPTGPVWGVKLTEAVALKAAVA